MNLSNTKNHIRILITIPNLNQEPDASLKPPDQDKDALCTFKVHIDSPYLVPGSLKVQVQYLNHDQDAEPK